MGKESFIIYKSFYEPVKSLSDRQLGRLFRALFDYQIEGSTQVDVDLQMAFSFFKNQMDIDEGKYQKVIERNKRNGSKGGRPPKEENPKNPVGLKKPKKPDNENENENENEFSPLTPQRGAGEGDENFDFYSLEIPDDGCERNFKGLVRFLNDSGFSAKEKKWVIALTDYGRIHHPIWQLIEKSSGKWVKSPRLLVLADLKKIIAND